MKTARKHYTAHRTATLLIAGVIMATLRCAFAADAARQGDPDYEFSKATMKRIVDNAQQPMSVFSKKKGEGAVPGGAIVLNADGTVENKDSYILFTTGAQLSPGGKFGPVKSGDVFFNIGNFPVKVGDFVLKKGEAVLYNGQKLETITLPDEARKSDQARGKPAAKSSGNDPESRYKWKSKLNVPAWVSVHTDATIRGFMKDGRALQELSGTITSFGQESLLDVPGCRVRIEIDPNRKRTDYCSLTFTTPCALEIAKDDTLLADKESVVAEDAKGGTWTSRKVILEGKEIFAFFEDKGGQVANEAKPANTGGSKGVAKASPAITSDTPARKPASKMAVSARIEWPQGSGYVTEPKKRPAQPHDPKTSKRVAKTFTTAEIVAAKGGQVLLSKASKVEFRESKPLLVCPGAEVRYLCTSPGSLELEDFNGDLCLLPSGITVRVDSYGQFIPVNYQPDEALPPPSGEVKTEATVLDGGMHFGSAGQMVFSGVIGGAQTINISDIKP